MEQELEAHRYTAVIADDDEIAREIVKLILTNLGIRILREVECGWDAVELVKDLTPNLLCLDLEMPGGNGLDALRAIRTFDPYVVVVMISSRQDDRDRRRALQFGADAYLSKPVDRDQFQTGLLGLGVLPNLRPAANA